jgi:hypothetical protein
LELVTGLESGFDSLVLHQQAASLLVIYAGSAGRAELLRLKLMTLVRGCTFVAARYLKRIFSALAYKLDLSPDNTISQFNFELGRSMQVEIQDIDGSCTVVDFTSSNQ